MYRQVTLGGWGHFFFTTTNFLKYTCNKVNEYEVGPSTIRNKRERKEINREIEVLGTCVKYAAPLPTTTTTTTD